jgi:tRNA (cmo5U34)-methyltransferase
MMPEVVAAPQWDERHSREFLDFGAYFVPERSRQIDIVVSLIPLAPPGSLLVELCCGEGLLSSEMLRRFRDCRVLALDGSARMRARTLECCGRFADRITTSAFDLAQQSWRSFPSPPHAIVSSLAIHHLDGPEKRALYRDLAASLAPGGALVVADIVRPPTAAGLDIAAGQWDEAVRSNAAALCGGHTAVEAFERLRWNYFRNPDGEPIDKPSSLVEQLYWLQEAGLVDVDCAWLFAGHAIFSGRKRTAGVP